MYFYYCYNQAHSNTGQQDGNILVKSALDTLHCGSFGTSISGHLKSLITLILFIIKLNKLFFLQWFC